MNKPAPTMLITADHRYAIWYWEFVLARTNIKPSASEHGVLWSIFRIKNPLPNVKIALRDMLSHESFSIHQSANRSLHLSVSAKLLQSVIQKVLQDQSPGTLEATWLCWCFWEGEPSCGESNRPWTFRNKLSPPNPVTDTGELIEEGDGGISTVSPLLRDWTSNLLISHPE